MIRSVYTKWLWDSRRSLLAWTLGILVVGCGYAAFWPTIDNPDIAELIENYPEAILEALNYDDITTPEGYLTATVYGLVVAVLMLVFAIAAGTRIIASEEEAGTLDLTLSYPVSRTSAALQRVAAFVTAVIGLVAVFWVTMLLIAGPAGFDSISAGRFAAMHLHLALFTIMFGSLSYSVGAATGRRALALAVPAVAGVIAWAASGIIPQVEGLEWVRDYSAFTWLTDPSPLASGVDAAHVGIMAGLSVVFVAVGTVLLQRRDLAV